MGMELDVLLKLNKHGSWAGCLIDVRTGMQAALPLNQDMLPCLPLKNGEKFQWHSKPDSLADLVERYGNAGVAREKRARRNNHVQWQTGSYPYEADRFAPSRSESPGSSAEGGFETEEDLNCWMQQELAMWEN